MPENEQQLRFEQEVRTQFGPLLDRLQELGAGQVEMEMVVAALGHQIVMSFLENAVRSCVSNEDGFRIETAQLRRSARSTSPWTVSLLGLNEPREAVSGRGATIAEALFHLHAHAGTLRPLNQSTDYQA